MICDLFCFDINSAGEAEVRIKVSSAALVEIK